MARQESYLKLLALTQLRWMNERRVDPEDLVQETFARAHLRWDQFHGDSDGELAAWLRGILTNYLRDLLRKHGRLVDEQKLQAQLNESSARLDDWLACGELTPRSRALREELITRLGEGLLLLPDAQREAIELRYLHGLSIRELATRMQRSSASVGGLLQRGLSKLRAHLAAVSEESSHDGEGTV